MANEPVIQVAAKMRSLKYNGTNGAQVINGLNATAPTGESWTLVSEVGGVLTARRTIQDKDHPQTFDSVISTNQILVTGQDNTGLGEVLSAADFALQYYVLP